MSCPQLDLPFSHDVCSGHGICVHGSCVCDPGWTGLGDFNRESGYGCPIHKSTIRHWSVANLIGSLMSTMGILLYMKNRKLFSPSKLVKVKARTCISLITMNLGTIIFSIAKICDQERFALGGDILSALGFLCAVIGGLSSVSNYLEMVLRFFRGHSKIMDNSHREKFLATAEKFSKIIQICTIAMSIQWFGVIVALIVVKSQFKLLMYVVMATFNEILLINLIFTQYLLHIFSAEVKEYLKQVHDNYMGKCNAVTATAIELTNLCDKVALYRGLVGLFFITSLIFVTIFLSWPCIRNKISYLMIVLPTFTVLIGPVMMYSLTRMSETERKKHIGSDMIKMVVNGRYSYITGNMRSLIYPTFTGSTVGEGNGFVKSKINAIVVPVSSSQA